MKTTAKIIAVMFLSLGMAAAAQTGTGVNGNEVLAKKVARELANHNRFVGINVDVINNVVNLTGSVPLYIDKLDAQKKAEKTKGVDSVRNQISVEAKDISDTELREALANKLRYDRIGYGIVFNNLAIAVENGRVTITGKVRDYPDRDSAIAIVESTHGVQAVVDEIDVAPISLYDDQLRVALARAIYQQPGLQMYAMDPQAPIRIVVEHGHVELHGVVSSALDRQVAFTQANGVPGVFSLKNYIRIAEEPKTAD